MNLNAVDNNGQDVDFLDVPPKPDNLGHRIQKQWVDEETRLTSGRKQCIFGEHDEIGGKGGVAVAVEPSHAFKHRPMEKTSLGISFLGRERPRRIIARNRRPLTYVVAVFGGIQNGPRRCDCTVELDADVNPLNTGFGINDLHPRLDVQIKHLATSELNPLRGTHVLKSNQPKPRR